MNNTTKRCDWVTDDPLYIEYHDREWGVPVHDDIRLFEMLVLEGTQAGLNWLTILKKRNFYRIAYDGFDPVKIASWSTKKVQMLLRNPTIIRNKLKIESAIINARAYLKVMEEFGSFDRFIWSFVDGKPIHNSWRMVKQIPATTPLSDKLSKELYRRGFKFVGSTICYSFMQAVGMVNDHIIDCFRYDIIRRLSSSADSMTG
jgi:DNA-3-methyladenine glycosylase I